MKKIGQYFFWTGKIGIILTVLFFLMSTGCDNTVCKDVDKQITLIAIIKAKAGKEEAVKRELTNLLAPTRKEAGCLNYNMHIDPQDNSRFMFYENWECQSVLDDHLNSPHIQAFIGKTDELLAEPIEMSSWEIGD